MRRDTTLARGFASLLCGLLVGSTFPRTAFAVERGEPADTPTFVENTPAAQKPLDTDGKLTAAKARTAPISANGTFSQSIPIQVPPGRRGMTPSLALSYDSGSAAAESAVGAGWSFGVSSISRSTRGGFPKVTKGTSGHEYATDGTFTGPNGEMVPATDGPTGAQNVFAPRREQSAVRYVYDASGFGSWVEHLPSGNKRYYGRDPFTGTIGVVRLELGTASWLLLREEDPYGNDVIYEYHNVDNDPVGAGTHGRSVVRRPVLKRVRWGGNRLTQLAPAFRVQTTVSNYSENWRSGPIDVLDGTQLDDKIDRIAVSGEATDPWWTYKLSYEASGDTGKLRLRQVDRIAQDSSEAIESRTFRYSESGPKWSARRALPEGLDEIYSEGVTWKTRRSPFTSRQKSMELAFNPPGVRAGIKFVDLDGNGAVDAIYHAAGIHTTGSQPVWSLSALQTDPSSSGTSWGAPSLPRLLPPYTTNFTAPAGLLSELVDLEGDGDTDGISFPVRFTLRSAQDDKYNLPAPTNRSFMIFSHCASPAFWEQECKGVEPLPPWVDDARGTACETKVSACFTPPYEVPHWLPGGQMLVRAYTNKAKTSGVATQPVQLLEDWPPGVDHAMRVTLESYVQGHDPRGDREYEPTTESDFFAPSADINADGKKDLVLLKHMAHWAPNRRGIVSINQGEIRRLIEEGRLRPLRAAEGSLENAVKERVGNELYPVVVSEDLLLMASLAEAPRQWMEYEGSAADLGLDGIPGEQQALIHGPMPGPLPVPRGGPFGPHNPIPPRPESPPPRLNIPVIDRCGTIGSIWDLPVFIGAPIGRDGGLLLDATRFVPRAYLSVPGGDERHFVPDSSGSALPEAPESAFTQSLANIVNNGNKYECNVDDCKFPPHVQWNTLFLDVNADGLQDLVVANEPSGPKTCSDGHTVFINRGFKWEKLGSNWRWEAADVPANEQALAILANRNASCNGNNGYWGGAFREERNAKYPVASMSPVDINADGRVDIVFSFKKTNYEGSEHGLDQRVYLNNGRAFVPAEQAASNYDTADAILPPVAQAMLLTPIPQAAGLTFPKVNWPDTARFTDIDNDGLIDIVQPGRCKMQLVPGPPGVPDMPGLPGRLEDVCLPGAWYRNEGTIPDLMTNVTKSTGAWTEIDYAPPVAPLVSQSPEGLRPNAMSRVVRSLRSASGPRSVPTGYESFPVQEVTFGYRNFVRDPESTEVLGYEKVIADFKNTYRGNAAGAVRVTRTFDVRRELTDASGHALAVRFPLKGAPVSTVIEADGWTETEDASFSVEALGQGVRIRPLRQQHGSTSPAGQTAWSGSEMLDRDAYGNATRVRSGNSDGTTIGPAAQVVTKAITYENRPSSWQIGLLTRETTRGYSEDADGTADLSHVLADTKTTYTARGAVESITRVGVTGAGCSGSADDATTFEYYPNGLVHVVRDAGRREVSTVYDAFWLYPARRETVVGRAVGLQFTPGATTLSIAYDTDLRTGSTTAITDANDVTIKTSFDSRGRQRTKRGPGNVLIEETTYADSFPMFVQTRGHTDTGKYFDRRTDVDAAGNTLAVVEGRGTSAVPYVRTFKQSRDAFGRAVESFLPEEVATLTDGWRAAQSGKATTEYDGLDRPKRAVRPDGTTIAYAYEPRATTETDARGTPTRRLFDAFGELVVVHRNPGGAAHESASHFLVRDGLGSLVRVVDGDGNVRQIERDGGGRVRLLTLPQKAGTPGGRYTLCHDVDDKLESLQSPAGRVTRVTRDELGRPIEANSTDANGNSVVTWQNYDDPAAAGGLGRVTAKSDASGVYGFTYDPLGLPRSLTFAPSPRALAGASNTSASYAARFAYSQSGGLTSVNFDGLPSATTLTYQHDDKGRTLSVESFDGSSRQVLAGDFTYDAAGRTTEVRYGNGTSGAWHYDELSQRLNKIAYSDSSQSVFSSVEYLYDANGNPRQENRSKDGTAGFYTQKLQTFDALDRLSTSDVSHPRGNGQEAFAYTPGGNLKNASDEVYTYDSPSTPQAVSLVEGGAEGRRSLRYDDDGYLREENSDRGNGAGRKRALRFNGNGCLAEVAQYDRLAAGGPEVSSVSSFVCGLDGRVVGRHTKGPEGASTRIDFAGLAEIRPEEGTFLLRVPINGTTSVEEARSLSTGERITASSGYLHTDVRGSVLAATAFDNASVLMREAEYDGWGKTITTSSLATPTHAFVNHEPVPGVGYYNFGSRAYDPSLRRWLSPDPLLFVAPDIDSELGEELNLYQYASNNPARHIDPSGNVAVVAAPAAAGGVAAAPFIFWGSVAIAGTFVVALVQTGKAGEAADRTRENVVRVIEKGKELYNQIRSAEKAAEAIQKVEKKIEETSKEWVEVKPDAKPEAKQASEGVYEFPDQQAPGKQYVGQSKNMDGRLDQHQAAGRFKPGTDTRAEVPGGKTAREVQEQKRINELGGKDGTPGSSTSNKRNPIGPARQERVEKEHGPIPPPPPVAPKGEVQK